MGRVIVILKSWVNALLGRAENPALIIDAAYEQYVNELTVVRRSVADVATEKHRIQKMVTSAQEEINKLGEQAEQELHSGNEDLARRVLERKAQAQIRMEELVAELQDMQVSQDTLEQSTRDLADKIESFGRQKEVKKAKYRSAEAQVKIGESITGINRSSMAINRTLGRMEERTERAEARALAIPELIASGTLVDLASGGKAPLDRELEASRVTRDADRELEAMKERLGIPAKTSAKST